MLSQNCSFISCLITVNFLSFAPEPIEIYMISFRPSFRELSIQFLVNNLIFDGGVDFEQLLFLNVRSSLNGFKFVLSKLKQLYVASKSAVVMPSSFFRKTSALKRTSCFIRLRLIFGWSSVIPTVSGAWASHVMSTVVEVLGLSHVGVSAKEILACIFSWH